MDATQAARLSQDGSRPPNDTQSLADISREVESWPGACKIIATLFREKHAGAVATVRRLYQQICAYSGAVTKNGDEFARAGASTVVVGGTNYPSAHAAAFGAARLFVGAIGFAIRTTYNGYKDPHRIGDNESDFDDLADEKTFLRAAEAAKQAYGELFAGAAESHLSSMIVRERVNLPCGSSHAQPPGNLLFLFSQIVACCEKGLIAGRSIIKIREQYPDEPALRIEECAAFSGPLTSLFIFLAPRTPTEDPRGGKVPLYERQQYAPWFATNVDVQETLDKIWNAAIRLPKIIRDSGGAPTADDIQTLRSGLDEFEGVVRQLRARYEVYVPPFRGFIADSRQRSFTGPELQNIFAAMRTKYDRAEPIHEEPHKTAGPNKFTDGLLVFYEDRVELCGADICSGGRSKSSRRALEALSEKRDNSYVALTGDQIASKAGIKGGQNGAAGLIARLRDRISKALAGLNIECGESDVILSRGPGYRFSQKLTVQNSGEMSPHGHVRKTTGTDDRKDVRETVRNVRKPDVRNVGDRNVRNAPANTPEKRRDWIIQELTAGRRLQAPDVVKKFGCSLKTAQRDFQALTDAQNVEYVGAPSTGTFRLKTPVQADA